MSVNGTAAYGIYPRNVALAEVVSALNQAGFENQDICLVLSPAHPVATVVGDAKIGGGAREDSASSARMIGWFSKFGAVVIPTVGFFIRSQEFFQALLAEQNFPSLSRGARILLGLGFSTDEATRLGHQLCDVGALVYVSCQESAKVDWAIELLRRAGAREAASLGMARAASAAA
jgi:hypothetical protein